MYTRTPALHRHICGGFNEIVSGQTGCGWEWAHLRLEGVSDEEYDANHMCPQCGAGPWMATDSVETVDEEDAIAIAVMDDDETLFVDAFISLLMRTRI